MEPKYVTGGILVLILLVGSVMSDIEKDREKCGNQLVGLATCLPYVGGNAKAPTLDCCDGLKEVLKNSKECLCILVKDRNDPSLGLKINATLALGLPTACHAPANISQCPELLHLPLNSPDAKVFEDFVNSAKGSNSTSSPAAGSSTSKGKGSSAQLKSNNGGRGNRWLVADMICVVTTSMVLRIFLEA
ncbi:hypothetical protein NMG60_11033844 [Bertholletia excelsa]